MQTRLPPSNPFPPGTGGRREPGAATSSDKRAAGVRRPVSARTVGQILSVVRQGLTLGAEFGPETVEALLWVAETVEESVYEPASLAEVEEGLSFALANPPLRTGAFSAVRVRLNGVASDPALVALRTRAGGPWRRADSISAETPIELRPGERIEVTVRTEPDPGRSPVRVRLELECPAIPPLVWLEFEEVPREGRLP
jgi:hypothetical protein